MQEGDIIDGRYKVLNKLGQGGMGQVFRGRDFELEKDVAIKVLFPNTPDQVIHRFHTEAKALAKFNHPNIMKVEHFGQATNGQLYLINEFVKGDTLSSLIETRGPQTFFDMLPIFEKLCRGLRYAHMEGVLHRDIKPSNVMLSVERYKDDSVKLVDFGLAKPNDQDHGLTKTGTTMGSPAYMSPEAVHGKESDERSDIYSLGCTLFEMLAATPPFALETPFHTMMAHINRLPPTLSEACDKPFDEEVEEFVQKFIKKDPADRFQNMDEVIAELERVKNRLTEKKIESQGMLASGIYASGAWITDKTKSMNKALKVVLVLGVVAVIVSGVAVYMKYAFVSAPKSAVDGDSSQTVTTQQMRSEKYQTMLDKSFTGQRSYQTGATIIKDRGTEYQACVLSGKLDKPAVHKIMNKYGTMKCFQFQDVTIDDTRMRFVLGFPLEKVIFSNTEVTDTMLEAVAKMKSLMHLRITECGDLAAGSLDLLRPLSKNEAFLTLDLDSGKNYKHPFLPFAEMPKLTWVTLQNCTITREDAKAIAGLKSLTMLRFKSCEIATDALKELKAAPTMSQLSVSECRNLTPEHFQQIADLNFLTMLQMNDTNVDNAAIKKFKSLKNLLAIDLKNTNVDIDGVKELKSGIPTIREIKYNEKVGENGLTEE